MGRQTATGAARSQRLLRSPATDSHIDPAPSATRTSYRHIPRQAVCSRVAAVAAAPRAGRESRDDSPLDPPGEPISGDSHAHLLAPLTLHAASLGFTVQYEQLNERAGYCSARRAGRRVSPKAGRSLRGSTASAPRERVGSTVVAPTRKTCLDGKRESPVSRASEMGGTGLEPASPRLHASPL